MRRVTAFDMPLFLCILILVGAGIVAIYTSSYPKALEQTGNGMFFAFRQMVFALIGLLLMMACAYLPLRVFHRWYRGIIAITLLVLIGVLLVGAAKHGNRAWIELGPVQFQPSEFAKVAIILTLSTYLVERPWTVKSWKGFACGPMWFLLAPLVLVGLQGDLGTAFVLLVATVSLLAVAGMKFRMYGVPALILLLVGGLGVSLALKTGVGGHRLERVRAWQDPFNKQVQQSYQPRHSLIAIGSGQWWGRGFCGSRQKWGYLPGAQNDYIMAIMAEELGFVKLLLFLFVPYVFLIYRGFTIAHRAPDEYGALVASGCTLFLAVQALINMAVVTNLIPCMGINLPFISYGGSSIIASMIMAGLLLNVSATRPGREVRRRFPAAVPAQA
jgi:cell division protein FtsW